MHSFRIFLAALLLSGIACGDGREREKAVTVVFPAAELAPASLPELLAVLEKVIKAGNPEALRALYTSRSREAVLFSNTVGIGTAGTVDERLLDEIAATRVPQTNDRPGGIRALQPLSDADSREILLSWPSGKEFSLALVKEQAAVRIDVLASPGGEILLINR